MTDRPDVARLAQLLKWAEVEHGFSVEDTDEAGRVVLVCLCGERCWGHNAEQSADEIRRHIRSKTSEFLLARGMALAPGPEPPSVSALLRWCDEHGAPAGMEGELARLRLTELPIVAGLLRAAVMVLNERHLLDGLAPAAPPEGPKEETE